MCTSSARPAPPELSLESTRELNGAHGIFNTSPTDHLGLDQRARVMVKVEKGAWKYLP